MPTPNLGETLDKVGDQLPAIAITAASLTLVFLGFLLTAWEGYDAQAKAAVKKKYQSRGLIAVWALQASLVAVALGLIGIGSGHAWAWVDYLGMACLALWGVLTSYQGYIAFKDIG